MKYGDLTLGQIEAFINVTVGSSVAVRNVLSKKAFITCHEAWKLKEWRWVKLKDGSMCSLVAPLGVHLGLSDGVDYEYVCKRAKDMGFRLCPDEIIGLVRSAGDFKSVTFATSLMGDVRNPHLITLNVHGDTVFQDATPAGPDVRFNADHRWVFQAPPDEGPI